MLPRASFLAIQNPSESHALLEPLAGRDCWVFGLDGDELYDPHGLSRLRAGILAGEFQSHWMRLGHAFHVAELETSAFSARGYSSPPCRSMTKLYNFAAIESWSGPAPERLHGGTIKFRDGYSDGHRKMLLEECSWEDADFRCLHLCFLRRSSLDQNDLLRPNIMDKAGEGWISSAKKFLRLQNEPLSSVWKRERYGRGPLSEVDTKPFFIT